MLAVSRIRVSRLLLRGTSITTADLQVLFYAMRLNFGCPPEARDSCYNTVKSALIALEQYGQFSTEFLGAYALLAMYEVGHGAYPAAFLSVSGLISLFSAFGLHDKTKSAQVLRKPG